MRRAIELARKGEGRTSPNPVVGAVIVKGNKVLAEGYHKKAGGPHAEIEALKKAGKKAKGATLIVTLEPCCHFGKTPPCTDAIIKAGIRRVLIGARDPNPKVAGKGIKKLKEARVIVEPGLLKKEADRLVAPFSKFIKTGHPYVTLKAATSLDGKIATSSGESQWITGVKARQMVHGLRNRTDAILVGAGTAVKDDPRLSARLKGRKEYFPLRVVVDPSLRVPLSSQLFQSAKEGPVISIARPSKNVAKKKKLEKLGVEVIEVPGKSRFIELKKILNILGQRGIVNLMIEGGSQLNALALESGIVDKVVWFLAPVLIGGRDAKSGFDGKGIPKLEDSLRLKEMTVTPVGDDLMLEGYL